MSAPRYLSASTRMPMGRFCIRSVPVMVCSPSVAARKAVMKRMAVPAALMSMTSGMCCNALMMTSVSSQSLRLLGRMLPPAMA